MVGWLVQWPTIPTLSMFPILAYVYARLARSEEREVAAEFGDEWTRYAAAVHPYLPHRPPVTVHAGRGESVAGSEDRRATR